MELENCSGEFCGRFSCKVLSHQRDVFVIFRKSKNIFTGNQDPNLGSNEFNLVMFILNMTIKSNNSEMKNIHN